MSGLSLDTPGNHLFIRSTGEGGIRIADTWYERSLMLTAEHLVDDWAPQSLAELEDEHLAQLLAFQPDLVLLGVGRRQQFLHPSRQAPFLESGVGLEVMTTEAACRTFNILVGDGRKVAAGLLPLKAD